MENNSNQNRYSCSGAFYTHLLAYAHLLAVNEDLKNEGKKLINALHDEIDTAKINETHAETLTGIYYWKGYRQALERALTLVLRVEQQLLATKEE